MAFKIAHNCFHVYLRHFLPLKYRSAYVLELEEVDLREASEEHAGDFRLHFSTGVAVLRPLKQKVNVFVCPNLPSSQESLVLINFIFRR